MHQSPQLSWSSQSCGVRNVPPHLTDSFPSEAWSDLWQMTHFVPCLLRLWPNHCHVSPLNFSVGSPLLMNTCQYNFVCHTFAALSDKLQTTVVWYLLLRLRNINGSPVCKKLNTSGKNIIIIYMHWVKLSQLTEQYLRIKLGTIKTQVL